MLITLGTFLEELYANMQAASEELQDQADTIDSVVENNMGLESDEDLYDDEDPDYEDPDDEDLDYEDSDYEEESDYEEDPDYDEDLDYEDSDYEEESEEEGFTDVELAWIYIFVESADRIAKNAAWCEDAVKSLEDLMKQPEDSAAKKLIMQYFAAIQTWYELDETDRVAVRKAARAIEKIEEALADEGFTIFDGPATYVEMMENVEDSEAGYGDDEVGCDESKR